LKHDAQSDVYVDNFIMCEWNNLVFLQCLISLNYFAVYLFLLGAVKWVLLLLPYLFFFITEEFLYELSSMTVLHCGP